jgi:hypothetical protein
MHTLTARNNKISARGRLSRMCSKAVVTYFKTATLAIGIQKDVKCVAEATSGREPNTGLSYDTGALNTK